MAAVVRPSTRGAPVSDEQSSKTRPALYDFATRTLDRFLSRPGVAARAHTTERGQDHDTLQDPAARFDRAVGNARTLDAFQSTTEREEYVATLFRLRRALRSGGVLWCMFFVVDWLMATYVHAGDFLSYAVMHALAGLSLTAGTLLLMHKARPSEAQLSAIDTLLYGGGGLTISLTCALYGGLASPYAAGIPLVLSVRVAFLARPWRRSLLPLGTAAFSYPLVLLGAGAVNGSLQRSLQNSAELSMFAIYNVLIWTAVFATLAGGHTVWTLRRQVFEARNIGRYRLVRPIAQGGMAEVWVAYHATLKRDIALKILRANPTSDDMRRRFEREVDATSELTHPNTIRVLDCGVTDDGLWYYAMELVDGEDLARTVAREGPLSTRRCIHIMLQVSGALAEAHARGIVHRDIKPENVLLCQAGGVFDFVKVVDFGIAKRDQASQQPALTKVGRVLGTPAYISPEVATGRPADARSDVYGLGGLLYFLLTGTAPFFGSDTALLVAHAVEPPTEPSARLGLTIEPALEQLVMRCLRKQPSERFADAGELHEALRRLAVLAPAAPN
jgi:serine/threonine-protein kinase